MASEFRLTELGESVESGTVAKVLVAVGDAVAENQPVLELETDKAVAEIPSSVSGTITELRVSEGQLLKTGDIIFLFDASAAAAAPAPSPKSEPAKAVSAVKSAPTTPPPAPRKAGAKVLASPSVRRLARELGVDLKTMTSSDPSGRVTAEDVRRAAEGPVAAPPISASTAPASGAPALADLETGADAHGPVAFEPMNAIRRKTAEHMTRCWTTIPHVTQFDKADITEAEVLRKKLGPKVAKTGGKLTAIAFVIKALAEGLKRFPKFNASLDLEQERLIFKQYINLGVAVETPTGLLVPVLRGVDQKSLADIAVELPEIAAKARDRKLALEDMQGGSFTVTNLGGLGGTAFTPIINAPEVAILGMSRSSVEPVYRDGEFVPRTMLPLSLSYDHRVIDGADAARFLRWVAGALEEPWTMFLGL